MRPKRTLVVSALFALVAIGVGVWLYPHLPARMPIHWDLEGHANGWSSRFWAVAIWPLVIAGLALLAWLLPVISPRKFEISPFVSTFGILILAIQAFLLVMGVCAMLAGAGYPLSIPPIGTLAVGALFMVLGNYMGKLRKNFFIGIRTPWTLASDAVWERTHRLGGWVFMLAGLAWVIAGLVAFPKHTVGWMVAIVLVMVGIPYVYSYFIYQRLSTQRKFEGEGE